jgi:hypothetical protein
MSDDRSRLSFSNELLLNATCAVMTLAMVAILAALLKLGSCVF